MGTRARRFFARFDRLKLSAPLVEASSGNPEFLGQLIDALAGPHALHGHALKLPGIPLSSLHCCFLSRRVCPSRVCQFKGSFQEEGAYAFQPFGFAHILPATLVRLQQRKPIGIASRSTVAADKSP